MNVLDTANPVPPRFRHQCEIIIRELGLGQAADIESVQMLTGGVSSDIAAVRISGQTICIKCALDQLRVDARWNAPVRRNLAEYRWIEFASAVAPGAVPTLLGRSEEANGFAMRFIEPDWAWNYKAGLLAGRQDTGQAGAVGHLIGQIHAASVWPAFESSAFQNATDFYALRLEPYLRYTATKHPEIATYLNGLAAHFDTARIALVHGDVSPKNVLIGADGPILLDAECATFGDPAFDIAFFANHLVLKSFHLPAATSNLLRALQQFFERYLVHVTWEAADEIERRACKALPAMMLARIDGKSPVEYLTPDVRNAVRREALQWLKRPVNSLTDVIERINNGPMPTVPRRPGSGNN